MTIYLIYYQLPNDPSTYAYTTRANNPYQVIRYLTNFKGTKDIHIIDIKELDN